MIPLLLAIPAAFGASWWATNKIYGGTQVISPNPEKETESAWGALWYMMTNSDTIAAAEPPAPTTIASSTSTLRLFAYALVLLGAAWAIKEVMGGVSWLSRKGGR